MNALAGFLLIHGLNEQETYWIMKYLLKMLNFKEIIGNEFQKLKSLNYQLEAFLKHKMQNLFNFFV